MRYRSFFVRKQRTKQIDSIGFYDCVTYDWKKDAHVAEGKKAYTNAEAKVGHEENKG